MTNPPVPTPPSDKPTLWYPTDQLPQDEDLLIVFHGLLSFCYLQDGLEIPQSDLQHCEVGVFNQDRDHQLRITTIGSNSGDIDYKYTFDELSDLVDKAFRIGIVGLTDPAVSFYQGRAPFNRATTGDPYDFRWLVDAESPDLYNRPVRDHKAYYKPKLLVKHGTFLTLEKTSSTFKWVKRGDINSTKGLGSIAFCTGVKIALNSTQQARFQFWDRSGKPVTCTFGKKTGSTPAKIFFTNICYACLDPTANDFYHHFESFTPPLGEAPWDLQVVVPQNTPHGCGGLIDKTDPITDPAPCHAMGYGQSPGGSGG